MPLLFFTQDCTTLCQTAILCLLSCHGPKKEPKQLKWKGWHPSAAWGACFEGKRRRLADQHLVHQHLPLPAPLPGPASGHNDFPGGLEICCMSPYPGSLGVCGINFFVPSRTQPCSLIGLATLFGGTNLFERHAVNLNTSGLVARRWQNPMEKEEMEAGFASFCRSSSHSSLLFTPSWRQSGWVLNLQFANWTSRCFCAGMG